MSNLELNNHVENYFEIMEEIERLQEQAEAIKDTIKYIMVEKETETLKGLGWSATWHNTTTNRLDSTALKKAEPEIYNKYCKVQTGTRFTLVKTKA